MGGLETIAVTGPNIDEDREPEPARARIFIPDGSDCKVSGFGSAAIEQEATVEITGKVSVVESSAEEWNKGRRLKLEVTSVVVKGPDKVKKMSISDALKEAGVSV